ncbi:MAG: hypothetical protein NZM37_12630, partial [Sandaracinaceae bacterium]|nr:hypothetical protein [Sandaracinaceae bacterium]
MIILISTWDHRSFWKVAIVLLFWTSAITGEWYGDELGLWSSVKAIEQNLGQRLEGERCTAILPRELPKKRAERWLEDCDFRIEQIEKSMRVSFSGRIQAFFFRNHQEKKRFMGASHTYIAKPWRREVYLQLSSWPHPVLRHEIVHVVAGAIASGPFRVAGRWGGIWPSPGIIEGVAVALAWDSIDGMTPHQWARALLEIGRTPTISKVEGIAFLLEPPSRAYTANGSFVRWIIESRGIEAIHKLYRSGSYEEALGIPVQQAEKEWREFLRTVPLPSHAIPMAQLRFEKPALFGQVCPHAIASIEAELSSAIARGDEEKALDYCNLILSIDPTHLNARINRITLLARLGRFTEAETELDTLIANGAGSAVSRYARERLADMYWRMGQIERTRSLLEMNLELPQTEDDRRQVEVRLHALGLDTEAQKVLRAFFSPDSDETVDAAVQVALLARLIQSQRSTGLAAYLIARQMFHRERFDETLYWIGVARGYGMPLQSIEREAERMEAISLYATDRLIDAENLLKRMREKARAANELGRGVEIEDWLERVHWKVERLKSGQRVGP